MLSHLLTHTHTLSTIYLTPINRYALFIPPWRKTPTNVKIVVRSVQKTSSSNKHHKKNSSSSNNSTTKIGICVTRHSEESKTGGRRQRAKAPTKKLLLSQEPLEPLKPTSLNKTQLAHLAESNGVFDVERKHQVQRRDWAVLSSFSRSSDACVREYLFSFDVVILSLSITHTHKHTHTSTHSTYTHTHSDTSTRTYFYIL